MAVFVPTAAHAMTTCTGYVGPTGITIGVGGNDIYTTPTRQVNVCVVQEGNLFPPPTVVAYQNEAGGMEVHLIQYSGGPRDTGVRIYQRTENGTTDHEVVVPVTDGTYSDTCILFWGGSYANPGNCLLHIEQ